MADDDGNEAGDVGEFDITNDPDLTDAIMGRESFTTRGITAERGGGAGQSQADRLNALNYSQPAPPGSPGAYQSFGSWMDHLRANPLGPAMGDPNQPHYGTKEDLYSALADAAGFGAGMISGPLGMAYTGARTALTDYSPLDRINQVARSIGGLFSPAVEEVYGPNMAEHYINGPRDVSMDVMTPAHPDLRTAYPSRISDPYQDFYRR